MKIMRCDRCKDTDEKETLEVDNFTLRLETEEFGVTICKIDLCEPCRKKFEMGMESYCSQECNDYV